MSVVSTAELNTYEECAHKVAVVRRLFPLPECPLALVPFFQACDATGEYRNEDVVTEPNLVSAFKSRLQACHHAAQLNQTPILGICGTVNSGKSSIVSSLLSEKERARVLIGELGEEGTHRFVFWLPASWQTNGLDRRIQELIHSVTGKFPELLSDDPSVAASQYNARKDRLLEFNIPLIAYDAGLDESGIALLDCPDIQRSLDESSREFSAVERLKRLRSIAPLCSAFIVVVSMQQAGTEDLGKVFDALEASASQAPLYFVLNMTKTSDVTVYRSQAEQVLDRWKKREQIRRMYFAPFVRAEDGGPVIPRVVSLDEARTRLTDLKSELDPAELQITHQRSCLANLLALTKSVRRELDKDNIRKDERIRSLCDKISQFIGGKFITQQDGFRALHFNEAAFRLAESLRRTAPLSIRVVQAPGNWLQNLVRKFKTRGATTQDEEKYASIKPDQFAHAMLGHRFLPTDTDEKSLNLIWKNAWQAALSAPQPTFENPEVLDRMTRSMWKQVPNKQKWVLFRNLLIALGGFAVAGALAPLDSGLTLVIWTKAHMILGGWEIMALLVGGPLLAVLASIPAANLLVSRLENDVAIPQISFLYAGLLDGLGVPRYLDGFPIIFGPQGRKFPLLKVKLDPLPTIVQAIGGSLFKIDSTAWQSLEAQLDSKML